MVANGEGVDGGIEWEVAVSRCKLICRIDKQQGSTYSTENYTRYPMINHNEKECFKKYLCITESLCCTAVINITSNIVSQL